MGYQIFEMADGQRVALYAQGNSLFSCLLPFGRRMFPVEVKRDYMAHLEAVIFRDTVCYVYEDLAHRVVMDTLGAGPARIVLTQGETGFGFCDLRLQVREGELYLFYQAKTGYGEGYGLYVCMPYLENRRGMVCTGGKLPAEVAFLRGDTGIKVICAESKGGGVRIFDWIRETEFVEYCLVEEEEHSRRMADLRAAWEQEKQMWDEKKEEIQAEARSKLGEARQERQERLEQCRREYEGKVEKLRGEYEEKLAACRGNCEMQLQHAKKQYDELAQTAMKLQQIGRRWRDKYFGKEEATSDGGNETIAGMEKRKKGNADRENNNPSCHRAGCESPMGDERRI